MLVENPASESLTDNPWQVGQRNSFESFLNLAPNCSLSEAKVMAGMPQIIIKPDNPMKNWILKRFERLQNEVWYIKYLINLSFTSKV